MKKKKKKKEEREGRKRSGGNMGRMGTVGWKVLPNFQNCIVIYVKMWALYK